VVGDVRQQGLDVDVFPEIQLPFTQSPVNSMAMLVRTAAEPAALTPAIRAQARALDPNLPLTFVQTMDDVMATSLASRRFGMRAVGFRQPGADADGDRAVRRHGRRRERPHP
jgi:putative ABC transport system permease protein